MQTAFSHIHICKVSFWSSFYLETKLGRKSFTSGQAEERHFVYPKITVSKSDSLIDTFSDTKEFGKMSEALLIHRSFW